MYQPDVLLILSRISLTCHRTTLNLLGLTLKIGLWFHCITCNTEFKGQSDCPFTFVEWKEHIKSGSFNSKKLAAIDSVAKIKKKHKGGKVFTSIISYNYMKSIIFNFLNVQQFNKFETALLKSGSIDPKKSFSTSPNASHHLPQYQLYLIQPHLQWHLPLSLKQAHLSTQIPMWWWT